MDFPEHRLPQLWECGYSIAELWGFTPPVARGTSEIAEPHGLVWGILRLAEDQIDKGAGHTYLRQRIAAGDWIGIGFREPASEARQLALVPRFEDAKFGRKQSAVGDGITTYVNVRFVHQKLLALM
jgi:hypothetical protein